MDQSVVIIANYYAIFLTLGLGVLMQGIIAYIED